MTYTFLVAGIAKTVQGPVRNLLRNEPNNDRRQLSRIYALESTSGHAMMSKLAFAARQDIDCNA